MRRPAWQQARIVANQRRATVTRCACGAPVVAGLDADTCAFPVTSDPVFLTWPGELAASQHDRPTFTLMAQSLFRRDRFARAEPSRHPVLAAHRCNQPIPQAWRTPLPPLTIEEDTDVPGF